MHIFLTDVLAVLIVLGILVLVHEAGHYFAAKLFGVRVEVFSLGFGKRLLGFKRGDTDYRISALPFGGYVRMSGENPMEEHTGDPAEFMSHPRWQRFVIALAGPAMNVLLSIAVLTGVYMVHYENAPFLKQPAVVGWVEQNSPAAKIDVEVGDRIITIDNATNPTWETVLDKVLVGGGQPVNFSVQRGDQVLQKQITFDSQNSGPLDTLGILPQQTYIVTREEAGLPASKAGVQVGDEVVSVDGILVRSTPALSERLQQTKDKPVQLVVRRGSQLLTLTATPQLTNDGGKSRYRVGLLSEPVQIEQLPFGSALSHSLETNRQSSFLIIELLQRLVRHKASIKQMSGPVGIAQVSGAATREGLIPFLYILAVISLNLGIFNLLPIPILDGGLILLLFIEALLRRDIKREVKELVYQAAFVFLILFAVIVIYNDITKTALGKLLHLS